MAVTEGAVTIGSLGDNDVFYNPPQVFNRDLSMMMARIYAEGKKAEHDARRAKAALKGVELGEFDGISIIEPLAASGLRSLRYALEVPEGLVKNVVANDLDPAAAAHIIKNRERNNVPESRVTPSQGDANAVLHKHKAEGKQYDIVDLDPYGSVSPFLDSAIYNIKNGGMLCLTSTDMPVLGGNMPEVCFYKYGGHPLKRGFTHELSLRLVLNAAVMTAAKYSRHIKPILCLSVDFYVRLFLIVQDKPFETKLTSFMTAQVLACSQCESFNVVPFGIAPKEAKVNKKALHKHISAQQSKATEEKKEEAEAEEEEPKTKRVKVSDDEKEEGESSEIDLSSFAASHGVAPGVLIGADELRELSKSGNGRCRAGRILPCDIEHNPVNCLTGGATCGHTNCIQCGASIVIGGPFYRGELYDKEFLQRLVDLINIPKRSDTTPDEENDEEEDVSEEKALAKAEKEAAAKKEKDPNAFKVAGMPFITMGARISGMISSVIEELADVPLYYNLPALFKVVKCRQLPLRRFKAALVTLGYRVSFFHRDPQTIKTDAPDFVIWDIVRRFAQTTPPKDISHPTLRGLKDEGIVVPKSEKLLDGVYRDTNKNARFLPNPRPNWGPKARATGKDTVGDEAQ